MICSGKLPRNLRSRIFLGLTLLLVACGAPARLDTPFADYLPFLEQAVGTDLVYPGEDSGTLLTDNWATPAEQDTKGLWVQDRRARFRFASAARGTATLELECQPFSPPGAPRQVLSVKLNGNQLSLTTLHRGWGSYELPLPQKHLRSGWNEVELEFRQALRPHDFNPQNPDRRTLAARFRKIRVRSPSARPPWPQRPAEIVATTDAGDRPTIEMPADSFLEIVVRPRAGTRLVGAVDAIFADADEAGELRATLEAVETSGKAQVLFKTAFRSGSRRERTSDIDLSPWAGHLLLVRMRSWGQANGIVRWHGLGVITPRGGPAEELHQPGELVSPPRSGRLQHPDIIFILLDAARADAFEGDAARATVNVEALAARGTRFQRALAPSSWTGQTIPALLTGRYPDTIGAEHWGSRIPEDLPTLAELLSEVGYFTVLWSQHSVYRGNRTLRRGFESFAEVRSDVLADRQLLPGAEDLFVEGRPTFAFIHLLPPHQPYDPPPPFKEALTGWYRGSVSVDAHALFEFSQENDDISLSDEDKRYIRALYDENVLFADHLVGRLLETLRHARRYEDALIVLLADHGEAFFEHGAFLHTTRVYDEFIRVPLIIKWPRALPGFAPVAAQPVSLVDLAPTLVDGLPLGDEGVRFQGYSLLPLVFDDTALGRDVYSYTRGVATRGDSELPPRPHYALASGPYKLVYDGNSGVAELFNKDRDPLEQHDLAAEEPLRARFLLQRLLLHRRHDQLLHSLSGKAEGLEELDPDVIRQLRSLGYIGSG
ncbi:MAG: sulfatase [Acidobacteriota bacterium]